ncbi:MAG: hypothetical protein HOP11_05295 [Saprospiraceae bacterium]|nr:hypothetical protein [Saprospiraceae bacterium]
MIKYHIRPLLTLLLLSIVSQSGWAQDTVRLFLDANKTGDTIVLQLTAKEFKDVESFVITFNYPDAELNYSNTTVHPQLNVQSDIQNNQFISFSWINPNSFPLTLPDNSVLAEFKFFIEKRKFETCFDFNVATRPTSFFGLLSAVIPVQLNPICKNLFGGFVEGYLRMDINNDCMVDGFEPAIGNALIRFNGSNGTFYTVTNEDGYYQRYLPYNNYTVNTINSDLLQSCNAGSPIDLATNKTISYSSASAPKQNCALLETEFIAAQIELCASNSASIRYYNTGTINADNAYITLDLDPVLTIEESSVAFSSIGTYTYRFELNTIKAQSSGQINLILKSACNNNLSGRTVQNIARIFPNSYCNPANEFSGAEITVTAGCIGNENVFEIKNTGSGNMKKEIVFNTVEDDIMPNFGGKVLLDKDAAQIVRYPANGKTRIIIVDTIANHPYKIRSSAAIEGCGTLPNGSISKGYINNYSQGDEGPFISKFSTEIVSLANNALHITSLPEGAGTPRFINKSDRLRYNFVVRNITTSFVNRVVIRNKIPVTLDITTLRLARNDSKFTWSIQEDRVLEVVFEGLNLAAYSEDKLLSQFTFSYSIVPLSESIFNTKIENSAEIILDSKVIYNSNKTLHTVGNFIFTIIKENENDPINVKAFPNPCEENLNFDLGSSGNYLIQFFNQQGIKISEEKTNLSSFTSAALVNQIQGVYYCLIFNDSKKISSVKIIKAIK